MNAILFGAAPRERFGMVSDEAKSDRNSSDRTTSDQPLDAAWMVLEAANDLRDDATIEACRRVIDANLSGALASQSDLHVVLDYFR